MSFPPVSAAVLLLFACACACASTGTARADAAWRIDSESEWAEAVESSENLALEGGTASPSGKTAAFTTVVHTFGEKRRAADLVLEQIPDWLNWEPADKVAPANLLDAPVLLSLGPGDYWIFGRYGKPGGKGKRGKAGKTKGNAEDFTPEPATLEGFDIPLQTTPFPDQYDAPGGLEPGLGGYHAWQSRDMVHWVHHGPVTEAYSRWVTTAEAVDGKVYLYYDYPNDQDPHLYIDENLADGKPGTDLGLAFADPSDGSDCGLIRDPEGRFHVIYEDWSPIKANTRSWDSPLAGRAVSEDGKGDFAIRKPVIDERTRPTGKKATYKHPHWKQHPDWDDNTAEYEIHEPEQNAYGDWAPIAIGGRYYLFGDYDPAGSHDMSVAWFTSPSLDEEFTRCGTIGEGHPDPDICFAEGRFYLVTQTDKDYTSPGPWVESVSARVGVDTDGDGAVDRWSDWEEVREEYDHTPGFSKQIARTPARLDLSALPAGHGFQVEVRIEDGTANESKPVIDRLTLNFEKP